ncbi:MAG: rod shape-determining protein MreD [Chitinophagales bacterium]
MSRTVATNIIRFIGLLLFQALILNQVELHGIINPYIYPLFILLLPFETPKWVLLFLGFSMGISVDFFTNTPGLHAAVSVLIAYLRPAVLLLNKPISGYESFHQPNLGSLGFNWFVFYAGICIFIHHLFFFFLESYSFSYFFYTLTKVIASTIMSLIIIILYQYLFYSKR